MSELGPWAGLYNWAIEKLMRDRSVAEKDVLQVLAMRANPLGFCWPGTGYIANMIGRADSTVDNALRRLELIDFICIVRTQNLIRNRVDIDFQISPMVLFIAPEKQELAFKLWRQNRNVNVTIVIKESQPTTESRINKPALAIQHQNQQQQQAAFREAESPGESSDGGKNAKSENAENRNPNSGSAAKPTAAAPQKDPSPVPASPSPLNDPAAEQIAARIHVETRYMMSVAIARGLVVRYGVTKCEAALNHMARQTGIDRPAGFLRATLLRSEIDPVADGKIVVEDADVDMFKKSKYADYYKTHDENEQKIEQESGDE